MPTQISLGANNKNKKGSALVFSLIILSMMLTIAMSLSSAAVIQKKNASSTQFSVQAYQSADSAAQVALRTINDNLTVTELNKRTLKFSFPECVNVGVSGDLKGFVKLVNGNATIQASFFSAASPTPKQLSCDDLIDDVATIHTTAQYLDTVRAVELAVTKESLPIAWWTFEETTGTSAADYSGNGYDGTLTNGPAWTTAGKLNGAVSFDGVDDYVDATSTFNPVNRLGESFSIENWVYPTAADNYRGIWGNYNEGTLSGISLQYDSATLGGGWIASVGDGSTWHRANLGALTLNTWSHVAVVFQGDAPGSKGHISGYVNGQLKSEVLFDKASFTPSVLHETAFYTGQARLSADSHFKGKLDEVKIFSHALVGREIFAEYQQGLANCVGSHLNGTVYPSDEADLTANTALTYSPVDTAQKCEFSCDDYFDWNGTQCAIATCTGTPGVLPPFFSTVFDIGGANTHPKKNLAYSYSTSDSSTACEFKCNAGHEVWDGTNCLTPLCTGNLPPANFTVYSGANTTLTENKPYVFSGSDTATKCEYFCNSGYVYDNPNNTCKLPSPTVVDYLVVAGGGGGGGASAAIFSGGGGGAGGMLAGTSLPVSLGTYTITVGGGGAGGASGAVGGNGGNSSFNGITATGGGGGAPGTGAAFNGVAGGSGGGGRTVGAAGGNGIVGQGNKGGACPATTAGAGGGGAGAVGGNVVSNGVAAVGGVGLSNSITGAAIFYAGGGGGGGSSTANNKAGGNGGGGAAGVAGTANTGGGGGGKAYSTVAGPGAAGGSGVVIIRYPDTYADAVSTTGSVNYNNVGGFKIYTFTSPGSITF